MDQIYLISKSTDVKLTKTFVETYESRLTLVYVNEYVIDNDVTKGIIHHFDTLSSLTLENFDWSYYVAKYSDIDRHLTKSDVWKYWNDIGEMQCHNPINQCSITHYDDIPILLCLLQILIDAHKKQYDKILIINATDKNESNLSGDLLEQLIHIIAENDVCLFTYNKVNYAYTIDKNIYLPLLVELSYMVYNFDDILASHITHNNLHYQIFEHTTVPDQKMETYALNTVLDVNEDSSEIIHLRKKFLKKKYGDFLRKYNVDTSDKAKIDHIMKQYPYDVIKTKWNQFLQLNEENYFFLCLNINKFTYFTKLKIKEPSLITSDINIVYFDRDFYLKTYPCYRTVFKNYGDAFAHFANHGIREKLMPNNAIFTLTQYCQEYLSKQLLNQIRHTSSDNYQDDPIIYVLTRTCNREQLFTKCVESIMDQKYVNLRHIVSYDNAETLTYVKKFNHIYDLVDLTTKKSKIHPNEYIDYLYDHVPIKEPGWVLVLDDDDKFMTPYGLHHLKQYLTNIKSLVIWMLYRPDKFIYPTNKSSPIVGEIGSCCYLYHSTSIQKGCWGPSGIGDYPCFRRLFSRLKDHIYIDIPLTGVNYENQVSGWTAS
jgi:hypothetical protein